MIDAKTLDRFAKIMVNGITSESFPIIMAEVYQTVTRTNVGDNDEELDAIAKKLMPGMVDAFMMIENPPKCKKFSCLC